MSPLSSSWRDQIIYTQNVPPTRGSDLLRDPWMVWESAEGATGPVTQVRHAVASCHKAPRIPWSRSLSMNHSWHRDWRVFTPNADHKNIKNPSTIHNPIKVRTGVGKGSMRLIRCQIRHPLTRRMTQYFQGLALVRLYRWIERIEVAADCRTGWKAKRTSRQLAARDPSSSNICSFIASL